MTSYVKLRVSFYSLDFVRHIYMCQHLDRQCPWARRCRWVLTGRNQGHVAANWLDLGATNSPTIPADTAMSPYRLIAPPADDSFWLCAVKRPPLACPAPAAQMSHPHYHLWVEIGMHIRSREIGSSGRLKLNTHIECSESSQCWNIGNSNGGMCICTSPNVHDEFEWNSKNHLRFVVSIETKSITRGLFWWKTVEKGFHNMENVLTGGSPSSFCHIGVLGGFESTSHFSDTSMPSRSG